MDNKKKLDLEELDYIVGGFSNSNPGRADEDCLEPKPCTDCVNRLCPQLFCTPKQGQNVYICLKHKTKLS
ncbi:MAG: hypothetical protein LBM18_04670 [Oscillospiraceae bacterium]|jgi:hypothetical protein|nr:hypothetical protein [Oscillospiraceae bacterium]